MALTSTERSKRRRAHLADDHTLCDPASCNAVSPPLPEPTLSRGEQLTADLEAERVLSPAERTLAQEAGRLADRLDRLDRYLSDREWLQFEVAPYSTEKTVTVVVKLDRVMAEARQQQDTFRGMVGELRQSSSAGKKAEISQGRSGSAPTPTAPGLGNLTARIAARRGQTAG